MDLNNFVINILLYKDILTFAYTIYFCMYILMMQSVMSIFFVYNQIQ